MTMHGIEDYNSFMIASMKRALWFTRVMWAVTGFVFFWPDAPSVFVSIVLLGNVIVWFLYSMSTRDDLRRLQARARKIELPEEGKMRT